MQNNTIVKKGLQKTKPCQNYYILNLVEPIDLLESSKVPTLVI